MNFLEWKFCQILSRQASLVYQVIKRKSSYTSCWLLGKVCCEPLFTSVIVSAASTPPTVWPTPWVLWGPGLSSLCSLSELEMSSSWEPRHFSEVLKVVKVELPEDKGGVIAIVKKHTLYPLLYTVSYNSSWSLCLCILIDSDKVLRSQQQRH